MMVFYCRDHDAHYVGGSSVVVASDEGEARRLLAEKLGEHGLSGDKFTLVSVDITKPNAIVIDDGDY